MEKATKKIRASKGKLAMPSSRRSTDELMNEVGKGEVLMREVQQKLEKNRKAVRRWLSFMG